MGPMGIIIVHIQWLLLSNNLATRVCKNLISANLNDHIFKLTILVNDENLLLRVRQKAQCKNLRKVILNPTFQVYITGIDLLKTFIWRSVLFLISLIPIIGPFIANQLSSVKRSFNYTKFYFFNLKNLSPEQAIHYKYLHLTSFICFGMSAGLLEFLPLLSVLTMTSNIVGAALWSLEFLSDEEKLKANDD